MDASSHLNLLQEKVGPGITEKSRYAAKTIPLKILLKILYQKIFKKISKHKTTKTEYNELLNNWTFYVMLLWEKVAGIKKNLAVKSNYSSM